VTPAPTPKPVAPAVAVPAVDAGRQEPRAPIGVVLECELALPVRREGGHLFVDGAAAAALRPGMSLRLAGEGTETRDLYGMAMVVSEEDDTARLIADEPDRLPEPLYACPPEDDLPLKGGLWAAANGTGYAVRNSTDIDWTDCEVFLPNNTQLRPPPRPVIRAGKVTSLAGMRATPRRVGAEPKVRANHARIRCNEGSGELLITEPR
jgi:hypothetical protein